MRFWMFEVQKFMLDGRGEVFMSVFCRIDSLVAFLKVPFFIHTNQILIEV